MSTHVSGTYTDCGYGQNFSATVTCEGPTCDILSQCLGFVCTNSSQSLVCTNMVTCSTPSNITSNFTVDQTADVVVDNVSVLIANDSFTMQTTVTATIPYSSTTTTSVSRGQKSTSLTAFVFLIIISMFIPLACAQSPPSPTDVVNNIFSPVACSPIVRSIYQEVANQVCSFFVSKGVQQALLAAGDVVTEELKEAEGALVIDCQELLEAALIEDPSLELLMAVTSKFMCAKVVSSIMEGPFNPSGSEICQVIAASQTNSSGAISIILPPMTSSGICGCLAPTCVCPQDDGLPPLCGTTTDSSCPLCTCQPTTSTSSITPAITTPQPPPPRTTHASPPPDTTQAPPPPPTPTPTQEPPPLPPTPTQEPPPPPPPPPPLPDTTTPSIPPTPSNACDCLAPSCICPYDDGLPPDGCNAACGLCMC
jgi:hypothetical protein